MDIFLYVWMNEWMKSFVMVSIHVVACEFPQKKDRSKACIWPFLHRFCGRGRRSQVFFAGNMDSNPLRYVVTPSLPMYVSSQWHESVIYLYMYVYIPYFIHPPPEVNTHTYTYTHTHLDTHARSHRKAVQQASQGDSFFKLISGRMKDVDYVFQLRVSQFCLHLRGFQVWWCTFPSELYVESLYPRSCKERGSRSFTNTSAFGLRYKYESWSERVGYKIETE